jgi:hypothetical protein
MVVSKQREISFLLMLSIVLTLSLVSVLTPPQGKYLESLLQKGPER